MASLMLDNALARLDGALAQLEAAAQRRVEAERGRANLPATADDARAIGRMFERALGRRAFDDELAALVALVAGERARYAGRDDAARALAGHAADGSDDLARDAARTAAANAILNLDDFLTRS